MLIVRFDPFTPFGPPVVLAFKVRRYRHSEMLNIFLHEVSHYSDHDSFNRNNAYLSGSSREDDHTRINGKIMISGVTKATKFSSFELDILRGYPVDYESR